MRFPEETFEIIIVWWTFKTDNFYTYYKTKSLSTYANRLGLSNCATDLYAGYLNRQNDSRGTHIPDGLFANPLAKAYHVIKQNAESVSAKCYESAKYQLASTTSLKAIAIK